MAKLGEILVKAGVLDEKDRNKALEECKKTGEISVYAFGGKGIECGYCEGKGCNYCYHTGWAFRKDN